VVHLSQSLANLAAMHQHMAAAPVDGAAPPLDPPEPKPHNPLYVLILRQY
jgi:hypothetical protein